MSIEFEWDEAKANINLKRHPGVSFDEAKTIFDDEFSLTIDDPDHSTEEERYVDIGRSIKGRLLVVSYIERNGKYRIISARKATPVERHKYDNYE